MIYGTTCLLISACRGQTFQGLKTFHAVHNPVCSLPLKKYGDYPSDNQPLFMQITYMILPCSVGSEVAILREATSRIVVFRIFL